MLYVLAILCMGLPITTTIAGEWLNSLIVHDNIKCITTNGKTCWDKLYCPRDDHSFCTKYF